MASGNLRHELTIDLRAVSRYTPHQRKAAAMFVAVRAITYATLFIALLLIYLPGRVLAWSGLSRPSAFATPQIFGMIIAAAGAAIALWCIFTFVWIGKGTPAPFDAPRRLVIRGPYRFVRNPMYIGATIALAGAALFYRSPALLVYSAAFILTCHLFVLVYEEPTLRRTFGPDYAAYCAHVRRWWPVGRAAR
jgi:protein-S-isoprenylcysteine O-methyltransferase Ste14